MSFKFCEIFLLVMLFATSMFSNAAPKKILPVTDKIIIIGDSITDGYGIDKNKAYPVLLAEQVKKKFPNIEIVPSAISGSVTASAGSRLTWILKKQENIKGVMVVLGGNDLIRGIKPATMEKGYLKLLDVAAEAKLPVLLATMPIPMNYELYQQDLTAIYQKLREDKRVTILDDFLKGIVGVTALNQTDGIHPTELGHELIVKNISQQVIAWIEKIQKEKK